MKLEYARSFKEDVQGVLKARFRLDAAGAPEFRKDDNGKNYSIDLTLESPRRDKIDRVNYVLDNSYYDYYRSSTDRKHNFAAEITSYGDYVLTVKVHLEKLLYVQTAWLSELLEEGYAGETMSDAVRAAIEDIKSH